jgi:hypothetical protein
MREFILEVGPAYRLDDPDELSSFSDRGRAHLIEVGNRLEQRGLRRQTAPARVLDLPAAAGAPSHQIGLRVAAARRLEGLDAGAAPLVLLSADGADALVAWEQDGQLRYQESRGEGWSDTRAIALGTVGLERALQIVEHRVRNR